MQETWVRSLSREDPLEKETATHSSILAWEIPWTEEPGGHWFAKSQTGLSNFTLAQAAITKYHRLGGLNNKLFSQFWKKNVWKWGASMLGFWRELSYWLADSWLPSRSLCLHLAHSPPLIRHTALSDYSHIILTSFNFNDIPKGLPLITITLGVRT